MPSVYFTGEPIVSLFGSQRALPSCSRLSSAFVAQPDDAHCLRPIRARAYSLIETLKQKFRLSATARDRTLLLSFCVCSFYSNFVNFAWDIFRKKKNPAACSSPFVPSDTPTKLPTLTQSTLCHFCSSLFRRCGSCWRKPQGKRVAFITWPLLLLTAGLRRCSRKRLQL